MRALFGHAPSVEHHDLVGVAHGREPVGHHEHGARRAVPAAGEAPKGRLDLDLVLRVGKGRRLVEHHDGRVLEDRAGEHEALHLAAGEVRARGAVDGVHALGQLLHDVRALCRLERGHDLLARGLGARRPHVVQDRLREEPVGLEDKGHAAHEVARVHPAHVHAAHEDAPGAHVPEARHEARRGGLAAAGGPHERHGGARRDLEAHVVERRGLGALVGEGHVLEADGVVARLLRVGRGLDHGGGEHLLHAAHGVRRGLERLGHEHHARHCRGNHGREDRVEREVGGKAGEVGLPGGEKHRHRHEEGGRGAYDGERERLRGLAPLDGVVLREHRELLDGVVERAEREDRLLEDLDHGDAAHVLGAGLVHLHERLHVARHEVHAAPAHHVEHAGEAQGDRHEAGHAQPPVKDEEEHEHAQDHGHRPRRVRELVGEKPLGLEGAAVHHAAQGARGVRVEVAEARAHEVLGRALSHVRGAAEGREVRAHEAHEVERDRRHGKAERPPSVGGDPARRAPVGGHGDEVACGEPDAHVGAKAHEHRDGRERAARVGEGAPRPGEGKQPPDRPLLSRH